MTWWEMKEIERVFFGLQLYNSLPPSVAFENRACSFITYIQEIIETQK